VDWRIEERLDYYALFIEFVQKSNDDKLIISFDR